ncbi:MAG: tRNA pseudouridine(38-40) synthase TruA [Candidatus Omnitrophica bacterium]|nr:tRNA pseudouridine(38-40) synthase TruA [Candidatus Omnitrophota bacterium]
MRNIRVEIEYEGTNYCGWQVQNRHKPQETRNKKSIQETIEKVLREILQEKVKLIVSGRTDAGVHAKAQVANFLTSSKTPLDKLQLGINALLPKDIAIIGIKEVKPDFHSRFSAKSKVYQYSILNRSFPSPFLNNLAYFYMRPLDVKLMERELKVIEGRHDFKGFQASGAKKHNTVRVVKVARLKKSGNLITIDIEANGFLYNMVRNIAGTLIEVGKHKLPVGTVKNVLKSKDRRLAGPTAHACGLCLVKVKY